MEENTKLTSHENITPVTQESVDDTLQRLIGGGEKKKELPAKPTVLIIDDNTILLRTVKEMLDKYYDVRIAISSEQAFKSFEIKIPDIILLDYEMPDMNGEETLKILRKDKLTKDIPVIFLTGSSDKKTVIKLLTLNPDGYVIKPPKKQLLLDHIKMVLYPEEYQIEKEKREEQERIERQHMHK